MRKPIMSLAALCMAASPAIAQSPSVSACQTSGPDGPAKLHESWILEGWERRPGDPTFVFAEKLGRYYELEGDGVFYDDLAPEAQTARRAADYGAMWEGPFNKMRSASHAISDGPDAIVSDTVASTTLEFVARLEAQDGAVTAIIDRSQLGWECHEGRCVIRHEHNSARTVSESEIAPFFRNQSKQGKRNSMSDSKYVGMWVTSDGHVRHELLPNGRYDEARGSRESAYQGRYEIDGNRIQYWDDTGFTADGEFIDGVLHHGGMIFHRKD